MKPLNRVTRSEIFVTLDSVNQTSSYFPSQRLRAVSFLQEHNGPFFSLDESDLAMGGKLTTEIGIDVVLVARIKGRTSALFDEENLESYFVSAQSTRRRWCSNPSRPRELLARRWDRFCHFVRKGDVLKYLFS